MREVKHFFVINPKAGSENVSEKIISKIHNTFKSIEEYYKIYITTCKEDATRFSRSICEEDTGDLRFYAIGGDGTLNEVINGIIGYNNASVSVLPYGTGNDFTRNFQNVDFLDLNGHINGRKEKIDLLYIKNLYCVNLCNIGFDAKVAENMNKFKKLPFVKGRAAYTLSIFYSLIHKLYTNLEIEIDNDEIIKGDFLLCAIANGTCYGGGYKGAPLAKIDDGFIDVCIVKKVSRFKLIKLINIYKNGTHLENNEIKKCIIYRKCKIINITSKDKFSISIDGEIFEDKKLNASIREKSFNFLIPQNNKGNNFDLLVEDDIKKTNSTL